MTPGTSFEQPDWNSFSPARMWRDWMVKSEAQWSDAVSHMLKDERAGPVLNKQIQEMQLMHRQFGEFAQATLAAWNMPSRSDHEALDERMGKLEDGLAQLSAAISQLTFALSQNALSSAASKPAALAKKPTRNRRPA